VAPFRSVTVPLSARITPPAFSIVIPLISISPGRRLDQLSLVLLSVNRCNVELSDLTRHD